MATKSAELDLRGLLEAMHDDLAAGLAARPQLSEEPRERDAFIAGVVDRHLPTESEQLFRLCSGYPPLWQRPLPPELLEEEGMDECATACLLLNLRFYCYTSLQGEAVLERLTPEPGERPGLLDDLHLIPPSGPAPGLRRIENGVKADFDEWLRATSVVHVAEDLDPTVDLIAAAWLPDAGALRGWLDLLLSGAAWLAEREIDLDLDELSPLLCLRANLHGYLTVLLREQLDRALPDRPDLRAALEAYHDLSGRDLTVPLLVVLPDPAHTCERTGAADPGQAALTALALDPAQQQLSGLSPRGAAWRFQPPAGLCETHHAHAARLARETGGRARFLQIDLAFAIADGAALRTLIGEMHDHPGEACEQDPGAAELARQALIELRRSDAETLGVLLL
jgi:hypothetical protein